MFWRKPGILIPDLYFYGVKIQTNIKQNLVEKYTEKIQFKKKINFFFFFGLHPAIGAGPNYSGWARIGPAMNSGSLLFTCYVNSGG